jgi:hypothetical protein
MRELKFERYMNSLSVTKPGKGRIDIGDGGGGGNQIASYRFDENLPKPCFHPLRTAAGHTITGFEPPDHPWQRGLWFAIKFINGSNFWEEQSPFGVQTTTGLPEIEMRGQAEARIEHEVLWTSQATGPVIREHRAIFFSLLADGSCRIDWTSSLEAMQDLLLDRTPFTTWGGYGGLTYRAPYELRGESFLFPGGQSAPALAGQPHPWAVFRGAMKDQPNAKISLGIIDHPENPRSPTPWYGKTDESYGFMNAAFLFHEPMKLSNSQSLHFRYCVLYRDGWWEADEFAKLAETFRASSAK